MILDKIPRIECTLIIPELITGELDNLLLEFGENSKSLKILKKYKKRIATYNYFSNLINYSKDSDEKSNEFELVSKLFSNSNNSEIISNGDLFNTFINSLEPDDKIILTKFIIKHIDRIINKYIKILVHIDDQVFVLSKLNKDNKKIFLKFFLPKIKKNDNCLESELPNIFDGSINSLKDNIHMTLLPTIEGHGLDGLFHLTFRIEGKKSVIFEYSKFSSINIDSNKLGIGIYPDEKCTDALIFKIIQNLSKLVEIIKIGNFSNFDDSILNLLIYTNMLEYLSLDILNELNANNKLEYIFEKYFYSLGKETIKTIIDKLFKIIIFTFVELYYGLS
jgi:hypothetical protein